ncbi:MAG: M48 family metallopeptidase [Acidobacteriia bacterium]|nr:M48 family metallopeptidase [Terriglobia bacterium]
MKFDPVAATDAYLAKVTPEQRARSDAYFEGGYWLQLWGFLYGVAVALVLLATRLSVRMRDLAVRVTRIASLQTALYWLQYLLVTTVLAFPLTVYQGFIREHRYGLATQTFGPWLGDQAKGLLVGAILGGLALIAIYAVIRRAPRTWWVWGAGISVLFLVIVIAVAPVFIEPLFNKYTPLKDESVRGPILRLARANGVPATDVLVVDASKQTTRVSANVAGFLGTERIALNDNLLNRCSLAEIESVMGHEMGHYVLNHVYKDIIEFGVLIVIGFAFLRWSFDRASARWGSRWGIGGIADVAGLPLLVLLLSIFFFVTTPVTNTMIRTHEAEADIFGLNTARQPDGEAEVDLKLGEYRKLKPGPIEEFIFFDHPSGYNRILMAMRWKAENLF